MDIARHPALARDLEAELGRGPIPFRRFMELALYHPEGGYYAQRRPTTGPGGDFQTSPHQSPWFGRIVARQVTSLWERLGAPSTFPIWEYGPGEGWLAHDILEAVKNNASGELHKAIDYVLVEQSAPARERIRERLANHPVRLIEAEALTPGGFAGLVLAHEFLDALPAHAVIQTREGIRERYVELHGGGLAFTEGPLTDARLAGWFKDLGVELEAGHSAEVCLSAMDWMSETGERIERGGALLFDYGFSSKVLYDPTRKTGTLRSFRSHSVSGDVLERPGEADLTAHVDFSAILRAAEAEGMTLGGFTDQCRFLLGLGLAEALDEAEGEGAQLRRERQSAMGILDPTGLGSAIKVMLLTKGVPQTEWPAFSMKPDDRKSLATLRG